MGYRAGRPPFVRGGLPNVGGLGPFVRFPVPLRLQTPREVLLPQADPRGLGPAERLFLGRVPNRAPPMVSFVAVWRPPRLRLSTEYPRRKAAGVRRDSSEK